MKLHLYYDQKIKYKCYALLLETLKFKYFEFFEF